VGDIHGAIARVMQEIGAVAKDQVNKQQGWSFRSIYGVYNALHPIMAKHGVFTIPEILRCVSREKIETKSGNGGFHQVLEIAYTFHCATDDSSVRCVVWGEAADYGDKVTNKCLSIAHKYALLQTFCVPTEDLEDPDAHIVEVAPVRTREAVRKANPPMALTLPPEILPDDKNTAQLRADLINCTLIIDQSGYDLKAKFGMSAIDLIEKIQTTKNKVALDKVGALLLDIESGLK